MVSSSPQISAVARAGAPLQTARFCPCCTSTIRHHKRENAQTEPTNRDVASSGDALFCSLDLMLGVRPLALDKESNVSQYLRVFTTYYVEAV